MSSKKNKIPATLWKWAGHSSMALGIAGIFLPLLPTVPFILLASACYLRGDPSLHEKLHQHPRFGPFLKDWEEGKGIPLRIKIIAISTLWLFILISIFWVVPLLFIKILLGFIAFGVSLYLLRLPTKKSI